MACCAVHASLPWVNSPACPECCKREEKLNRAIKRRIKKAKPK